jgi:hypothetical protein
VARDPKTPHALNAAALAFRGYTGVSEQAEIACAALTLLSTGASALQGTPPNVVLLGALAATGSPIQNVIEDCAALVQVTHSRSVLNLAVFVCTFQHWDAVLVACELSLTCGVGRRAPIV